MFNLKQIEFCAEECKRQKSGELSVFWMAQALVYLKNYEQEMSLKLLVDLAKLIEPETNKNGIRKQPARFANFNFALDASLIEEALEKFILYFSDMSAEEAYKEFEKIHPFQDGNGRIGALIYNLKLNSLDIPVVPPNFFNVDD